MCYWCSVDIKNKLVETIDSRKSHFASRSCRTLPKCREHWIPNTKNPATNVALDSAYGFGIALPRIA
jgi:hypothetical protein